MISLELDTGREQSSRSAEDMKVSGAMTSVSAQQKVRRGFERVTGEVNTANKRLAQFQNMAVLADGVPQRAQVPALPVASCPGRTG